MESVPNEVSLIAGIETLEKPVAEATIIAASVTDLFIDFILIKCFLFEAFDFMIVRSVRIKTFRDVLNFESVILLTVSL